MARPTPPPSSPDDTELQFYEAMQRADIDKLMALWADDEEIACVHPGGPRVVGSGPIRASFEAIFANGPVNARAERVRRFLGASTAIHHVLERVQVMDQDGPKSAWVLATNVYVNTAMGWRLAVHHASPGSPREIQEISEPPSVLH